MQLSKKIPARTKTVTAEWCKKDWLPMSPQFRAVRAKSRRPMGNCGWCGHAFVDGEMMALASFIENKRGNDVLCQSCAGELIASDPPPEIDVDKVAKHMVDHAMQLLLNGAKKAT